MLRLNVNGRDYELDIDPETPLLYVLRGDLQLNAAKFGCGLGQCGACTVLVDGEPTFSCITRVSAVGARKVLTLEGLGAPDKPGPVQQAFIEEQAAQCSYCIPGVIMQAQALLDRNPPASENEIQAHTQTSLCRCGSHMRIGRAIRRAQQMLPEHCAN